MKNVWYNMYINPSEYYDSIYIWNFDRPIAIPIHYRIVCSLFIPKTSENILNNIATIFERYREV